MTTLFGHSIRSELLLLSMAEALVGFTTAYALLAWIGVVADPRQAILLAAGLALCSGLLSGIGGIYQPKMLSRADSLLLGTAVGSLALLALLAMTLGALAPDGTAPLSWQHAVTALLAFSLVILAVRLGFVAAVRGGLFRRRLALVGMTGLEGIAGSGRGNGDLFEVAASFPAGTALSPERLRAEGIWGIVAADPAAIPEALRARCRAARLRLFSDAEFRERRLSRVDIDTLPPDWLDGVRGVRDGRLDALLRRGFDIAMSLALLLLTLPLLLLTALAIRLDSPGPIFYRQERVGLGGRIFTLTKFRSMVVDAERCGTPRWASKGDPRVTRVGRFIRLTRIDEVPQVLNVLRGDMAFVGPRPERPTFVAQLREAIPRYDDRAVVKPGITGWAQVNYPYGASIEDARMKLAYDLYYVRRRSLFLDFLILLATIRVVLFQEGAR